MPRSDSVLAIRNADELRAWQAKQRERAPESALRRAAAEQSAPSAECAECGGAGFVRVAVRTGMPQPVPCASCVTAEQVAALAGIPPRYRQASFANFRPIEGKRGAWEMARQWDGAGGFVLVGANGTGKTHLACALLRRELARQVPGRFVDVAQFLAEAKSRFGGEGEQAQAYIDRIARTPLLLIDDLGKERGTGWAQEVMWTLLNGRYSATLPTLITTNLDFEELAESYGAAIADRLRDYQWIEVGGKSMRGAA